MGDTGPEEEARPSHLLKLLVIGMLLFTITGFALPLFSTRARRFYYFALLEIGTEEQREWSLAKLQEDEAEAVSALSVAMNNGNAHIRVVAASELSDLGPDAEGALPILIAGLSDSDPDVRIYSAEALGNLGKRARPALPALLEALNKEDEPDFQEKATNSIGKLAPAQMVPDFIKTLSSDDEPISSRVSAAMILGFMGAKANQAIPALIDSLNHSDVYLSGVSLDALVSIGRETPELVQGLKRALKRERMPGRAYVAEGLCELGEVAISAKEELLDSLEDADPEVRVYSALALGNLKAASQESVPALIKSTKDPNPSVRNAAARSLGELKRLPQFSVPALIQKLSDPHESVRGAAADALGRFKTADVVSAVPRLTALLKDKSIRVRRNAAFSLGEIGELAEVALPELRRCAQHPDQSLVSVAEEAIEKITK